MQRCDIAPTLTIQLRHVVSTGCHNCVTTLNLFGPVNKSETVLHSTHYMHTVPRTHTFCLDRQMYIYRLAIKKQPKARTF